MTLTAIKMDFNWWVYHEVSTSEVILKNNKKDTLWLNQKYQKINWQRASSPGF